MLRFPFYVSTNGNKCLCHKCYPLLDYLSARKTLPQFFCSHKSSARVLRTEHVFMSHVIVADKLANPKIAVPWKPSYKRQSQMELVRVPAIWSCYEPSFAHSHNLSSHFLLIFKITNVLDHSVAINNIKILIRPLQPAGVTNNRLNFRIMLLYKMLCTEAKY